MITSSAPRTNSACTTPFGQTILQGPLFWVLLLAPLGLVFFLSFRIDRLSAGTALVLLSIAATFFVGVIAAKFIGGYEFGMSVVGFAVFMFLVFAIGRNLRRGR